MIINSAIEQGHTDAYIEDNNALYTFPYTVKHCRYIIDTLAKTATCGTLVMPIRSTEGNEAIWMWLNDDHQLYPFDTPIQKELEAHYNRHEADYDLIIEGRHYTISFTSIFFFLYFFCRYDPDKC